MIKKILVIGGTGMLGFPVAKQLKLDGYSVDILTTNPENAAKKCGNGYGFILGDVKNYTALKRILKNYDGLHINLNSSSYQDLQETEVKGCHNIINAVEGSEIKKITLISGLGVSAENAHVPFIKSKLEIENTLKACGLPYTIFNCTHFMDSISLYIRNGKAMIMGKQIHKIRWLAAKDYARMVSKSFNVKGSDFKNYSILGPQEFTMKEVFEQYKEKKDPNIKISNVSLGILGFIAALSFNSKLKFVVDLMRYFDSTPEKYDPGNLPDILGSADTTLDDWLRDHNS